MLSLLHAALFSLPTSEVLEASDTFKCPGSAALIHAWAEVTVSFPDASCSTVKAEMEARISGSGGWIDPHNGGTYSITSDAGTELEVKRVTANKQYTDKQLFTFTDSGSGCKMTGCSESQVTSVADFSTNFCNLHDLYCGSEDNCPTVSSDLSYDETVTVSFGASKDKTACIAKSLVEVSENVSHDKADVTLYEITGDTCGQSTLDEKYEPYAVKFMPALKPGTCPDHGYTKEIGTKTIKVPILGDITIAQYQKA